MATTELQKSENNCKNIAKVTESVIIKAFMNKPVRLKYYKYDRKSVTVICRDGKTQVNFAIDVVYQDDPEVYKNLRKAFESDDSIRLKEEWQKAKPIMST